MLNNWSDICYEHITQMGIQCGQGHVFNAYFYIQFCASVDSPLVTFQDWTHNYPKIVAFL